MTKTSFDIKVFGKYIDAGKLFSLCLIFSLMVHTSIAGVFVIKELLPEKDDVFVNALDLNEDIEIELLPDIPPKLIGGDTRPAPVEKQEWVEGTQKTGEDHVATEVDTNKISGDGTDPDGYLFSFHGDKAPVPIIDFDLRRFFPQEAKLAEIREFTVTMLVQIDETGKLMSAKVVSGKAMYGFNEAAIEVTNRMRFSPGYKAGKRVKMAHYMPIKFVLER